MIKGKMPTIKYKVITCREDHDLLQANQKRIGGEWPEFMLHDPVADGLSDCYDKLPDFQFVLVDPESGEVVSIANSIPLAWEGPREDLPDEGWDWALTQGLLDLEAGLAPRILCALQVVVFGDGRGKGISRQAVAAMKTIGACHDLSGMIAPVRPSHKSQYPLTPMERYVHWTNGEGLPQDTWMRVHARLHRHSGRVGKLDRYELSRLRVVCCSGSSDSGQNRPGCRFRNIYRTERLDVSSAPGFGVVIAPRKRVKQFYSRSVTGAEGMIGRTGAATEICKLKGTIKIEGTLWRAVAGGSARRQPSGARLDGCGQEYRGTEIDR